MANVNVEISAQIDKFQKNLDEAQASLKSFGASIQRLAIPAAAVSLAISAIGVSAVKTFAELEGVKAAFDRLNNPSLLDNLRKATKGTTSDFELMKNAVQASNFKLPVEQLASLMEFASRRAKDTGESVDYLVNSIVTGIGRKSPLILDNLGISAVALNEQLKGVSIGAASIADVTEAVGRIASAELLKMGKDSDTLAEKFLRIKTIFTNEMGGMGETISKALSPAIDAIEKLALKFQELSPEMKNMIVYVGAGTAAFAGLIAALGAIITIAPLVSGAVTAMTAGIAAITTAIGLAATSIIVNWSKMSYIITEISSDMLSMLSSTANGIAGMFSFIGRQDLAIPFVAAQAALAASSKNLSDKADIMRFEMHEATKEIADLNTEATNAISSATGLSGSLGKGADEAKRMGLEIFKLNGQLALNGKAFDANKKATQPEQFRQLDRGVTLDIPEVQFGKIYTDSEIAGIEAAERFSEFFNENINIGDMIGQGIGNIASTIGDAIGKGGNVIEAFGRGVLGAFGDFLSEFGKKLIAYGIAASAFAKLQLALLNPATALIAAPLAIAAGVALMIAGAAATSAATGRSAGQGSMGFSDTTTGTIVEPRQSQGGMELVLRGGDVYRMNKQYEKSLGYGG